MKKKNIFQRLIERARTYMKFINMKPIKKIELDTGWPEPPKEIPLPKRMG